MSERARFVELVILKSRELIITGGLNNLQLSQLDKQSGGSRSKIYNYFGNRFGLLSIIFEDALEKMKNEILRGLPKDLDFEGMFISILKMRTQHFLKNQVLMSCTNNDRTTRNLKKFHVKIGYHEDRLLSDIACQYYNVTRGTMTYTGLDIQEMWTLLLHFDLRNELLHLSGAEQFDDKIKRLLRIC